ncbi:MAG: PadR family transcriptional regulator [Chloroflexi bacterium]|nr:PadR family transcriptional regulator [Chloroflexota bacterium]
MFGKAWVLGFGPWRERLFEKGDLKVIILDLLKDKPRHGYEIIRSLEERSGGLYAPSPGAVYPTLQMLEDMGYVTVVQQDGKKIYTITEEGRRFLAEREQRVEDIWGRASGWCGPGLGDEVQEMVHELRDLARLFRRYGRGRWADPEKLRRIREVVSRACHDIEAILAE